jgi:hypothetical protein
MNSGAKLTLRVDQSMIISKKRIVEEYLVEIVGDSGIFCEEVPEYLSLSQNVIRIVK